MIRRLVIDIRFNNMGMCKDRLTRPWVEHRIKLFRDLTMNSLMHQTNQDFLTMLKYDPRSHDVIYEVLRDLQIDLPDNIRFVPVGEIDQAVSEYIQGADELYIARTDSDDLLHRTYFQRLHEYQHQPETWALLNQHGYYWDRDHNVMAPKFYASPQFYVLIYNVQNYLKGERYTVRDHGHVIKFPHEKLAGRNWVNVVHSTNTSPKRVPDEQRMKDGEIKAVLKDYKSGL
ncbi:glycosyltransferase [Paenibacillus woosongensis]|uniref:Glycosyltransferase n=1 Tax=Paenibacillus woosongensis TaxID=307580 RepID=A0AA95KX21_9BACL|nr:glycosyltransferase [Paenibacillus woosongensis]WHX50380.1 glycosyltransferase [Paenibacillus woosongensis]